MVNIAEQVCIEVTTCLNEHNLPKMEESLLSSLKTQIVALGDEGHAIRKLIGKHLLGKPYRIKWYIDVKLLNKTCIGCVEQTAIEETSLTLKEI